MNTIPDKALKKLMGSTYKKSLVSVEDYLTPQTHRLYIYPQDRATVNRLPASYHDSFPDIDKYIKQTIRMAKSDQPNVTRSFDCRMCPYFSKCLFRNTPLRYEELRQLEKNT
jgi:hypothetical protein